jgi:hypothetical protein
LRVCRAFGERAGQCDEQSAAMPGSHGCPQACARRASRLTPPANSPPA